MGPLRSKAVITAAIVIITIAGVMLLIRPGSDGQEVEKSKPGVVLEKVALVGNDKGARRWELLAGTLRQEHELVHLDQVDQLVLLEQGQPKYYIYADNGVWSPRENQLQLHSNVIVEDGAGFHLTTEQLIWDGDSDLLEFMGNTSVIIGKGGEADE
ncbi:MAG TPA: LPS export ABC transporter periplasmic protein LptC [Firmicutes bacterium]|nr:LPS export ABC transporter periplasmic protein LptC [Bacillota bacterium]